MAQPEIQVTPLQAEVSVEEFVKTCVDIPKFYACCEACPNFQKRWSCPPFSFSVEELWASFHTLIFYGKKIHTPSDWLGQQYSPQEMADKLRQIQAMDPAALKEFKDSVIESIRNSGAKDLANHLLAVYQTVLKKKG